MNRKRADRVRTHSTPRRGTKPTRDCPTGKARFRDHTAAVDALHRAATTRRFCEQDGTRCNRHEIRSYRCTRCNGWHLTSWAAPSAPRSE